MKLIKKKNRDEFSDKAAASIASFILLWQGKIAAFLRSYDRRLYAGQRKLLYATIGLLAIAYLTVLLTRVVTAPQPHTIKAQWLILPEDTAHFPTGSDPVLIPFQTLKGKNEHFSFKK